MTLDLLFFLICDFLILNKTYFGSVLNFTGTKMENKKRKREKTLEEELQSRRRRLEKSYVIERSQAEQKWQRESDRYFHKMYSARPKAEKAMAAAEYEVAKDVHGIRVNNYDRMVDNQRDVLKTRLPRWEDDDITINEQEAEKIVLLAELKKRKYRRFKEANPDYTRHVRIPNELGQLRKLKKEAKDIVRNLSYDSSPEAAKKIEEANKRYATLDNRLNELHQLDREHL